MKIGELVAYLRLDDSAFGRGVSRAHRGMKQLAEEIEESARKSDYLSRGLSALAPAAKAFSAAGLVPVLMGTVSAVTAVNGVIGLLPAAAFAGAVGIGALAVGFSGFGEALSNVGDPEKFAESLEKLSPAARSTAIAVRDLVPAWSAMKGAVQDRLFANLADDVSALGKTYIPMLGAGFEKVAGSANQLATRWAMVLSYGSRQAQVNSIVSSGALVWSNLLAAIEPLLPVLLDVGEIGGRVLAELTAGLGPAAERFQNFVHAAKETGRLEAWIRGGVAAMGDLLAIVGNVGSVIGSVFRAANMDGAGLLATVRQLTAGWAQWAASAEGQARMAEVFGALKEILSTTSGVLQTILPIIADLVVWFSQLPAPVQQAVVGFVVWGSIIGGLVGKLAPLIRIISIIGPKLTSVGAKVLTAASKWGLLGQGAKLAATATNGGVTKILAAMGRGAMGMLVRAGAMAAAWLLAMGPVGWIVAAVIAAAALIIANWDRVKAAVVAVGQFFMQLPGMIGAALTWLGTVIATGATAAWNWLVTSVQTAITATINFVLALPGQVAYALGYLAGLVYVGALAAWRWLSETLPMVIAAVLAWLAALPGRVLGFLTMLGSIIAAGAQAAWNWLLTTTISVGSAVIAWVAALPGRIGAFLAALPGILMNAASAAWNGFLSITTSVASSALSFIGSLPGRIMGFFSGAGSWLVSAGRAIVEGLWNGLKSMAQAVLDWIGGLGSKIAAGFKAAVGIHSPSKVFAGHGVNIGKGLLVGLDKIGPDVIASAGRLADDMSRNAAGMVAGAAGPRFEPTSRTVIAAPADRGPDPRAIASAVRAGIHEGLSGARMRVDGRGVAQLVNAQNSRDRRLGGSRIPTTTGTGR